MQNNYKQDVVRIPGSSKDPRCYDPQLVGFDSGLQAMCQLDVRSRNVLNKVFFPYIDQFAKDHFVEYELSEDDLILSDQPTGIQKTERIIRILKTIYTSQVKILRKTVTHEK